MISAPAKTRRRVPVNATTKTLTVAELCRLNDLPFSQVEKALASLQEKGLVSGFVAGDLHAEITMTANAAEYVV